MKYFDFFDRIKQYARENNTTIEALLSNALDKRISLSVYHGWKERANLPSGEYCYDLAQYMGVTCDWLISGKENTGNGNAEYLHKYAAHLQNMEKLNDIERAAIIQLAQTLAAGK